MIGIHNVLVNPFPLNLLNVESSCIYRNCIYYTNEREESMPRKSTKLPESRPKTEEADWYASPEGRRQTQREFERALKDGTLVHSPGSRMPRTNPDVLKTLLEQAKAKATRPVSIRLSIADIELAKDIASKRGTGYQTVLKEAIRHGLKRAG